MGKDWDHHKGGRDEWIAWMEGIMRECYRVMKPGAHGFVWAIPRTSHWTAMACENAGFEIRDVISHLFGSGFPKSRDIGKDIEKQNVGGIKNLKKIGTKQGIKSESGVEGFSFNKQYVAGKSIGGKQISGEIPVYEINNEFAGWGSALKPAHEDWILIRKPISEKNIALNVLKHGTGGLNIAASRIGTDEIFVSGGKNGGNAFGDWGEKVNTTHVGRFPSNVIFDRSQADVLDLQTGESVSSIGTDRAGREKGGRNALNSMIQREDKSFGHNDSGGASRFFTVIEPEVPFFYEGKAGTSERNFGVRGEKKPSASMQGNLVDGQRLAGNGTPIATPLKTNFHPTVKPIRLMQWLITLITPPERFVCEMCSNNNEKSIKKNSSSETLSGLQDRVQAEGQQGDEEILFEKMSMERQENNSPPMQSMRKNVQAERQSAYGEILHKDLRGQIPNNDSSATLQCLSEDVPSRSEREKAESLLFPHLFGESKRQDTSEQGLCQEGQGGLSDSLYAGASNVQPSGVFDGAQIDSVESFGADVTSERSSSSYKRGEGRQQVREFNANDEVGARQTSQAKKSSFLSSLPQNDSPSRKCPKCGGNLTRRAGLILDPFFGSGSTGVAAKELGFDCIGIEQDLEYVNISRARIAAVGESLFDNEAHL